MSKNSEKIYKTPEYTRRAVNKYYSEHAQLIAERKKKKYDSMTKDEKKILFAKQINAKKLKAKQKTSTIQNETNEQKEIKEINEPKEIKVIKKTNEPKEIKVNKEIKVLNDALSDEEKKAIIKAKRHEYYIKRKEKLKEQQQSRSAAAE